MADETTLCANVVNDSGKALMSLKELSREGDRIKIRGSLLGQWDTDMYMDPDQLLNAVQIVMNSPELLSYIMDLPGILKASSVAAKE